MTKVSAEDAIRTYLLYLENPQQLRDEEAIQKATTAVLNAKDPIEKLKALTALEKVAKVEEEPLRRAFIEHAKAWAEAQEIPVSAFRELRVSPETLQEAGFEVSLAAAAKKRNGERRQRNAAVPVEVIQKHVATLSGSFVLTDIQAAVGGSPATLRKAVDEMVADGRVEKLGPVENYQGRGRAPVQYKLK